MWTMTIGDNEAALRAHARTWRSNLGSSLQAAKAAVDLLGLMASKGHWNSRSFLNH
jgi:hypothetical protein